MKQIEVIVGKLGSLKPAAGGDKFIPLPDDQVKTLEVTCGAPFPQLYREFITTYGASTFPGIIRFNPIHPLPTTVSLDGKGLFDVFYGAESVAGNSLSLEKRIRYYAGRIPTNTIPIGDDGGGSQICLGISGDWINRIYYWDLQNEPPDEEDYLEDYGELMPWEIKFQNTHLIAETFEDFLSRLEISEE
jgi:hypothetical protein